MAQGYIGEIRIFAGNFAPNGWQYCDGTLLPISEHTALFQLIGTTYGGDGTTHFAVPDLRGRLPLGTGQSSSGQSYVQGQSGGQEQVTLAVNQLPLHSHSLVADAQPAESADPAGRVLAETDADVYGNGAAANQALHPGSAQVVGQSQPHENMQPWLGVHFIISLYGIYPSAT